MITNNHCIMWFFFSLFQIILECYRACVNYYVLFTYESKFSFYDYIHSEKSKHFFKLKYFI